MPDEKTIEMKSMSLAVPFSITTVMVSMNELKESIDHNINRSLEILSEPEKGALSYEYFGDNIETTYRVQKIATNQFAYWDVVSDTINIIDARKALATIYAHMPFVDMVGTELRMDLLAELAKRKSSNKSPES